MKLPIQAALSLLLSCSVALTANAIPAKRGTLHVEQPDGTTIAVQLVGDEHAHQYFTPDGYLLKESGGFFYYADTNEAGEPVSSGIRAADARTEAATAFLAGIDRQAVRQSLQANLEATRAREERSRIKGLFPESRFPAMGEQRAIVILVEYKDIKMTEPNAKDYFTSMLNEYGFNRYGGTGCAKEYFELNSAGNFICDFDVFGPITLSQNRSYYGGNDWYGNDNHPEMMVVEACQALDSEIDFNDYDRDHDGYVDNVFIFYAGRGEASGGSADTVWPHSWTLTSAGVSLSDRTFDGVIVDRYGCSNEYESGRPDGVGTFIHEFSHVIGLPDLYATSYTGAFTPGAWSALDYGPYNNDGCTPPNYGAFERGALGWMEPVRIQGPMNATLPPITENIAGIIYDDSNPDEYFLFENRQRTGWDTYIPGHGMLVWHVDYNSSVWASNKVNNSSSHQYCDLEEADGTQSEYTRDGDSFPGTSGVTTFTDNTRPSMKTWANKGFNLPLTEIAERNGIITFKVAGGAELTEQPTPVLATVSDESLVLEWTPSASGIALYANLYRIPDIPPYNDDVDYATLIEQCTRVLSNVNCGTSGSYTFEGLEPQTGYIVETVFRNGLQSSGAGYADGFTGRPALNRLTVQAVATEAIGEEEFTAVWEQLPEATDYLLTVYEHVFGAPYLDTCGFDGFDTNGHLPEGWSTNTSATYANASYSGAAIPALRLGRNADRIQSATYDDDIRTLSFWHRGNGTCADDVLAVYVLNRNSGLWESYMELPIVTEAGGRTNELLEIPAGNCAVRIEFHRTGTKGAVAIDDVNVGHGETFSDIVVEGYENIPTGNTDSYTVTGLKSETAYRWSVAGTDGTLVSRSSALMDVTTKPSTGINNAVAAGAAFGATANGRRVAVAGAEAGSTVTLVDLSGRILASTTANADGQAAFQTESAGFYIVRSGRQAVKVAVR